MRIPLILAHHFDDQAETIFTNLIESKDREISIQAKIIYASILKDHKKNYNKSKRLLEEVYESQIVQINHKIKSLKYLIEYFIRLSNIGKLSLTISFL